MDAKLKKDFSKIDNILSEYADKEGSLITILADMLAGLAVDAVLDQISGTEV